MLHGCAPPVDNSATPSNGRHKSCCTPRRPEQLQTALRRPYTIPQRPPQTSRTNRCPPAADSNNLLFPVIGREIRIMVTESLSTTQRKHNEELLHIRLIHTRPGNPGLHRAVCARGGPLRHRPMGQTRLGQAHRGASLPAFRIQTQVEHKRDPHIHARSSE